MIKILEIERTDAGFPIEAMKPTKLVFVRITVTSELVAPIAGFRIMITLVIRTTADHGPRDREGTVGDIRIVSDLVLEVLQALIDVETKDHALRVRVISRAEKECRVAARLNRRPRHLRNPTLVVRHVSERNRTRRPHVGRTRA